MNRLIAGLLVAMAPVASHASVVMDDPGDLFEMTGPGEAYFWSINLQDAAIGDIVESFTVLVGPGPAILPTFQIFGACNGVSVFNAGFDIRVTNSNGTDTSWTSATRGSPSDCGYHNYLDTSLPAGFTTFEITFSGADAPAAPGFAFADLRFGDTIPAIPLPGSMILLATGLAGLSLSRRQTRA